jgi:predicted metal-binding membrane protein
MNIVGAATGQEVPRRMASGRAFFGISALLFAASAALTIFCCASMSAMGGMPMPGGWTLSMAWMRMPGQTWPGAAASFLGMWVAMMAAMMLPSLLPMLWRYRQALDSKGVGRLGRLTALVGAGYFLGWTLFGTAAFPLGVALAAVEMQLPVLARAVPILAGVIVVIAGALQFSAWKARQLACCRQAPGCCRGLPEDAATAWRQGLRLGLHCSCCCAGDPARLRDDGFAHHGGGDRSHHRRTSSPRRRARRASHWSCHFRGGAVLDRARSRAWISHSGVRPIFRRRGV